MGDLVVARTSGVVMWQGRRNTIQRGVTVAHRDHPLVARNPKLWKDLVVHYDVEPATDSGLVEQATAAPGEMRPVPPAAARPTSSPESGAAAAAETSRQPGAAQRPPLSGSGSGVEAWRKYAAEITGTPAQSWAALSRERVIELLKSEGVIE